MVKVGKSCANTKILSASKGTKSQWLKSRSIYLRILLNLTKLHNTLFKVLTGFSKQMRKS